MTLDNYEFLIVINILIFNFFFKKKQTERYSNTDIRFNSIDKDALSSEKIRADRDKN
jgi:hypothetical protein